MSSQVINLLKQAQNLQDYWSPKLVGEVDDSYVKIAKVKGEFTWHDHEEDEFFMVLEGQLTIEMAAGSVTLNPGEIYVVPKGVMHKPIAENECTIMLFEKKTTLHTGKVQSDLTKAIEDQL